MADSTLAAIRTKVRRLTRTPSPNQMTDAVLDEYINTFVLYDFPEHLRTFSLRTQFTFYTIPYVDNYETDDESNNSPLSNFRNKYTNVYEPIFIDGVGSFYSQSRDQFHSIYPLNRTTLSAGTGDGIVNSFTGTLSSIPVLQGNVTFTYTDSDGTYGVLQDVPIVDASGSKTVDGNLYEPSSIPADPPTVAIAGNTINYATGVYTITFAGVPASGTLVNALVRPHKVARPQALLYWNNTFTVRPVPDNVYPINMEVDMRPTELLESTQHTEIEQWWQYIAYGSAKKVFEDRMDMESIQKMMPEFKVQEKLVLRRTINQQTSQRTPTIYVGQASLGASFGNNNSNGF